MFEKKLKIWEMGVIRGSLWGNVFFADQYFYLDKNTTIQTIIIGFQERSRRTDGQINGRGINSSYKLKS